MEVWVFLAKNITQKSQCHPGALVRYNQAQKYLQYDLKIDASNRLLQNLKKLFYLMEFSTD